jgi:hypothetical protein
MYYFDCKAHMRGEPKNLIKIIKIVQYNSGDQSFDRETVS